VTMGAVLLLCTCLVLHMPSNISTLQAALQSPGAVSYTAQSSSGVVNAFQPSTISSSLGPVDLLEGLSRVACAMVPLMSTAVTLHSRDQAVPVRKQCIRGRW